VTVAIKVAQLEYRVTELDAEARLAEQRQQEWGEQKQVALDSLRREMEVDCNTTATPLQHHCNTTVTPLRNHCNTIVITL
jgi:hypothetical protein